MSKVSQAEQSSAPRILEIDIPSGNDWLSAEELAGLTPEILRERVIAIKPLAEERARTVELNCRPDPEVWAALRKSGVFYMFVPKKFGGLEMSVNDLIEVMAPLGEACASTCWCATFAIEHNIAVVKAFPLERQAEIFEEFPYIIAPGVSNPLGKIVPAEGGYILNANWKWGSVIMNSDWVIGDVTLKKPDAASDAPPERRAVMIPAQDVTVLDTWSMAGMAGTGSNDIVVKDLFIPEKYVGASPVLPLSADRDHNSPIYRIPFTNLLALTTMLPALGLAQAAVEFATEKASTRKVLGTKTPYVELDMMQNRLGRADTMVRSAEALLHDAASQMMEIGRTGDADFDARTKIRSQITIALELCRDAVQSLMESSGASAYNTENPMQRYFRDIHVIGNHALYECDVVYQQRGRARLGLPQSDLLT